MPISLSTTGEKIAPCLWFDHRIEEAVKFYVSVFANSKIRDTSYYPKIDAPPGAPSLPTGQPMVIDFELEGAPFMALNGGPMFKFNEAISLVVHCETQEEVDYFWDALQAGGGSPSVCGWLKDRYGLSWQIAPNQLLRYHLNPDKAKAARAMQAMLTMSKIDIATIEKAAEG